MPEADREDLRQRIEAGEARNRARQGFEQKDPPTTMERAGEKVIEFKDSFTEFTREHPFTVVLGGLALGVAISTLFPRSPTRKAAARIGDLGGKAAGLAAIAAETAMAYAHQALDAASEAAQAGMHKLEDAVEDAGDAVGDTARSVKRDAAYYADSVADAARRASRDTGKTVSRAVGIRQ